MLLLVALFSLTEARAQTLFSEDFEGGAMPTGWTTDGPGTWRVGVGDYYSSTGTGQGSYNALITHGTTGNVTKLITPEIDLSSVTSAELSFMYVLRSWAGDTDELRVYYRTSSSAEWTKLKEYTTAVTAWTTVEDIMLPELSSTYQIAFEMTDRYGYGVGIDAIIINNSAYPKPKDLTMGEITTTTAAISWTAPAGDVTGYAYQYKKAAEGDEAWNAEQTVTSTSVSLSNLDSGTPYNFRVKAVYAGGESDYATINFTTDCNPANLPFTEGFEGEIPCWTLINESTANASEFGISSDAAQTGSNGFRFSSYSSSSSYNQYLISPVMNATKGVVVQFSYKTYSSSAETFKVGYSTTTNDPSAFTWGDEISANNKDSWALSDEYEFPAGTKYVAIWYYSNYKYRLFVDDFSFTVNNGLLKPSGLAAGTLDAHSVELSWTENGEATAWQICLNGDETNLVDATTNPFTLTGLDSDTDYTVKVRAVDGEEVSQWSSEVSFTTAVASPRPTDLAASDITTNSATLSWSGSNDSYVVQYRPWNPAGDDIQTTGTMVTYTYDLSAFTGTGSFAIRHYDISDMFSLIVDNIVVKDAGGNVVFSEDFESCGGNMPTAFTNMDLDGDGYTWGIADSDLNVDGDYGIVSASFVNNVGALTPDNWLIINGIELGGSISFSARGQDANYAAENFAVYVSTESSIVEFSTPAKVNPVYELEPNTPYAWQVQGVTGGEDSRWVSSFFKTLDDALVFTTAGDWNDISNWTDVNGDPATELPTISNNVRVEADATIPAGVIAEGKKITIADGASITIKDGGELKHSSATLKVSMEKSISADTNYLIASPFSGRTQVEYNSSWSSVDNLIGDDYDFYAFDPTQSDEWVNYESNPNHNYFTDSSTSGMLYGEGYLYANTTARVLEFSGTAWASNNHVETKDFDYDATSTDSFNGWRLIGNPFTCTGYITYSEDATFYKLNTAGTGFDAYENAVALAPGEGAFMKVTASGTITYSSEPLSVEPVAAGSFFNLVLPAHGEETDQDANPTILIFADNANNTSDIDAFNGQTVDVQLAGRTLYKDGSWNTICLPFDVTIAGSPLDGATVMELNTTSSSLNESTLTLNFTEVTTIDAGKPYLIKWASGDNLTEDDLVFNDVTIEKDLVPAVVGSNVITFSGNYAPVKFEANDESILYVGANNKLYYPNAEVTMNAFRAYFQVDGSSLIKHFALKFSGDDATGISTVEAGDGSETIYNVAGQRLNKAQKGVNIVNGKKILK